MLPLFDTIAGAQGGQGVDALARQFGLSHAQAQQALDALLPAFGEGLRRNAADPYGMGALLQNMASGQHQQFFDDPGRATGPDGVSAGNDVLGQLFGSKDLSRAVTAQAAASTGIGQDILKRMLPVIASMLMGGFFRQMTGGSGGGGSNPLGEIFGRMMGGGGGLGGGMGGGLPGGMSGRNESASANPLDNPWGRMLEGMFGGRGGVADRQTRGDYGHERPGPGADNPLGRMFEQWTGGNSQPRHAPTPEPRAEPHAQRPRNPYDDLFGQMFETGRQTRDDYQRGMESIFDQFTKGMDRRR